MSDFPVLNVFLSYARDDIDKVSAFYKKLEKEGWVKPWRDEEDLLKGEVWKSAISNYIEYEAHVVLVFLSKNAVGKNGYFQNEMRKAVEKAQSMPEREIFVVPILLEEDCEIPQMLKEYNWTLYTKNNKNSYNHILRTLKTKATKLGISTNPPPKKLLVEITLDIEYAYIRDARILASKVLLVNVGDITFWPRKGRRSRPNKLLVKLTERAERDMRLELRNPRSDFHSILKYINHTVLATTAD